MARPKLTDDVLSRACDHLAGKAWNSMLDAAVTGKLGGHTFIVPMFYSAKCPMFELHMTIPDELREISRKAVSARLAFEAELRAEIAKEAPDA